MSDRMTPIPFSQLMDWVLTERKTKNTIFGLHRAYKANSDETLELFGRKLETPIGPAAGPHTQLAQNIIAAYVAGSRFFELKTVQIIDGEDLPVAKPCILADDEGYNVEWSTELYVPQALDEYIKAWFVLNVISKEYELGDSDGFQFNMSVGYDLEGIKSEKIDKFIEALKDAKATPIFKECTDYLLEIADKFNNVTPEDIKAISPNICNSVTLSTLHGCPPQEIERIATYLLTEKRLNTFIKCNPTLLGYEFARKILDEMGYDYIQFGEFHFKDDLQYEDAVPMLKRLMALASEKKLDFGVKITNTFPVDIKENQLPGEEMYMSGKSLYPLSISLAAKLAKEFEGKLRISYSGGADYFNIDKIVGAGIWPVTVATTLLKPGGYQRLEQMAKLVMKNGKIEYKGIDVAKAIDLAESAKKDIHHLKPIKPLPSRKMKQEVPLIDCFVAPCMEGCPIHQDIPTYVKLTGEGKYKEALEVIIEKNPLPFITGTICAHNCMNKCTRNFYEESVNIRETKLKAAISGIDDVMKELNMPDSTGKRKAAVVGGGPAGLAASYFLARAGLKVTLYEKRDQLGGVIQYVIPKFRIGKVAIEKDIELVKAMGVEVRTNKEIESIDWLKNNGYDYIVLAVGASKPGILKIESGIVVNALDFLEEFKKTNGMVNLGKHVVVIGGGNTAMDTARAAKRTNGVENVSLVYRRTKRYMPADAEELELALEDGVEFKELLSPVKLEKGILTCRKMRLGEPDESGRRSVMETDETVEIKADTVIAAVGERVPSEFYEKLGINLNDKKKAAVNPETLETNLTHVYVVGDGLNGPATVVEAIRDAMKAAEAILNKSVANDAKCDVKKADIFAKKAILREKQEKVPESERCLSCLVVCENCVEVCPNRANISVTVPGMEKAQIVHVDYMCNECGNCKTFCPYISAPYKDKITLFADEKDMKDSTNTGFTVVDKAAKIYKVRFLEKIHEVQSGKSSKDVPDMLVKIMDAVCDDYSYLII